MEEQQKRRKFDKQFKQDAVHLAMEGKQSIAAVARDLGIDPNTLYTWKRGLIDHGKDAFPGHGRLLPGDEELRRLEKENANLREENAILKKAMGYFAKHGK